MKSRKLKFKHVIIFLFLLIFSVLAIFLWKIRNEAHLPTASNLHSVSTDKTVSGEGENPDLFLTEKSYATSHKKSEGRRSDPKLKETANLDDNRLTEPLTDKEVYPSDIYSEIGVKAEFQCYRPDAVSYRWEYYDPSAMQWILAEETAVSRRMDELNRDSSFYSVEAVPENNEKMIRCTIELAGEQAPVIKTAALYIISKEIVNISIGDTEFPAGSYLSIEDIPVTVVYSSGNKESFTGLLNGMHFVDKQENKEYTDDTSGNRTETVTTMYMEHNYVHLGAEEKEILMRYRIKDSTIEKKVTLSGIDNDPPVISDISVSDYEISTVDQALPVTVTINAYDNDTLPQKLLYAFLPEGQEITDEDWQVHNSFEIEITKNGTWTGYCRDQSGNISTAEKRIITVDEKAPVISEITLTENSWCSTNTIVVNASDELEILYRYCLPATGEDSGWIPENTYEISQNGTWEISVKDAVENVSEIKEFVVSNIDTQAPVIISITEGE